MVDLIIVSIRLVIVILTGLATLIAYRVARLVDHPPLGWVLLAGSFGIAFTRGILFFYVALIPSQTQNFVTYIAELLALPLVVLIFTGVYFMYRDFVRQLKERQVDIFVSQQPAE